MKKNVIVAFAGTLVIAAFAFSNFSFKANSIQDLKADAYCVCKIEPGSFCVGDDGVTIYIDVVLEC